MRKVEPELRREREASTNALSSTEASLAPLGGMGQSGDGTRFGSTTNLDGFTAWQRIIASGQPARYPFE